MFTNSKRQEERTGKYGTPRLQYLQELVTQFQSSTSEESKEKIVANLANFAYDPYNYTFLRQLNVLELFLDCITEPNEKVVEFGIGGICNSCVDPENGAIISQCGGIPLIIQCLSSPVRNSVNYALGALYYLCNESNKEEILVPEVVDVIKRKTRIPSFWQNLFCKKMFPNGKIEAVSPTTFPGTWIPCSEGNSLQFAAAENGHVLFTGCFGGSLQLTPSPLYWLFRRLITIHVCLPLNT